MRRLLKVLNPLIWLVNVFQYIGHLESQRHCEKYEPYDFALRDLKRF